MLFSSNIQEADLSRNLLGFKFGSHLITILININSATSLKLLDLTYNNLSYLVMNSINRLLDKITNNRTISSAEMNKYKIEKIIQEAPVESESLSNSIEGGKYHSSRRVISRSKSRSKERSIQNFFSREENAQDPFTIRGSVASNFRSMT